MRGTQHVRVGPYTWDDFVALDDADLRELIDGELVEVEVPRRTHEIVVGRLVYFLTAYAMRRGGMVLPSGYKIRISDRRGVMPDVQLYRDGNEPDESQDDGLVRGRPDLVIEVMSPSSRRFDRIVKLGYYAALRVPEYWLVDPTAQTVERLLFGRKGYETVSVHEANAVLSPRSFAGMRIPLADVWPSTNKKQRPRRRKA